MSVAQDERRQLCDLLEEVGPDAPTLCEGWKTRDLAAHLLVRESNPVGALGILVPPLEPLTDRAMSRAGDREWLVLVNRIRQGPPLWWRPIDQYANLSEYFVHHEDVRRGGAEGVDSSPRAGEDGLQDALWGMLRVAGRLLTRSVRGVGIEIESPGRDTLQVRRSRPGGPTARLAGEPSEVVLYLNGRKEVADVAVQGDDTAVDLVRVAGFGI